nr:hypothetical protein GCM10017547_14460 [Pseudarthrobacter oxydans]
MRWAQALSMALPRRPLTCWERFCRVSVMAWLASEIRWKWSTATAVRGSHIRSAFRNAAEGSIATTCTARRHSSGRAKSQSPTPLVSAVDHARDLTGVQIHDRCHPRLEPRPRLRGRVLKIAHGPEPVLINTEHPWAEFVHVR